MYTFQEYLDYREDILDEQFRLDEVALGPYDDDDEHRDKEIKQDIQAAFDQMLNYSQSPMTSGKKGPVRPNWRYANYAYWSQPKNAGIMKRKVLKFARNYPFIAGMNRATARAILRDWITNIWQQGGGKVPETISRRFAQAKPEHPLAHKLGTQLGVSGGEFDFPTVEPRRPGAQMVSNLGSPEGEEVSKYSSWYSIDPKTGERLPRRTRTGPRETERRYPQYA